MKRLIISPFPKKNVPAPERELLELLFDTPELHFRSEQETFWYELLFGEKNTAPAFTSKGSIRIIQFNIQQADYPEETYSEWKTALLSFFNSDSILLELSRSYGLIIEPLSDSMLGEAELEAVADTLFSDFFLPVKFFMGLFHSKNPKLRAIFEEERALFDLSSERPIETVETASLAPLASSLKNSPIAAELVQLFIDDETLKPLIETLYKNQGNISLTAKDLYMHRNSIQYRLDKFQEQTNLSLRKPSGLLFAYLCTRIA
ncbi:hypothetical protein MFLO_11959 [Listeria floridensis FSL S10-1187]|uniref:PucR C-terminal helix-turn-helix domain-containing protein n=1 Tax=Listeria floridensis FSL S10-1187 TaxID=1265817 RepID=A0ABN0RDP3_9LIST|nr:helix-turn-helix domain-containing protein [Listeria floridensis]EUJ28858.1 hypothetical protein MFLO_11959 [Listeria floridensis FSL S10-1187]